MKKECEFFDNKLLEYVFGELEAEPELKKKIGEHIAVCTDCWKKTDSYKKASADAESVMKVNFSDEVWEMQRKEIIKRVTYKPDILGNMRKAVAAFFTTRKLAAGFALVLFLCVGAGAGFKYRNYNEKLKAERTMISKVDMLENIEIIERLDFYKNMSEKSGLL